MRIYNATKSTMNLPMPNGSRLVVGSRELSRQFYPTVELLTLLVSAYTRDDIAIVMEGAGEVSMGAVVSALPGYTASTPEEAIERFAKPEVKSEPELAKASNNVVPQAKKVEVAPAPKVEDKK